VTRLPERNLDVLRALAVLCVLGSHAIAPWTLQLGPISIWQLGRMGVLLFFVHTSLVLMGSLERLERSVPVSWQWVKSFYIRRAFRIYPLAIAAVIVVYAFHVPLEFMNRGPYPAYTAPSIKTIAANLFLVQNLFYLPDVLGPLWSLPIEVQMYLVLPLLYLGAKRAPWYTGLALLTAIVAGLTVMYAPVPGIGRITMLIFAPCFVSGIIAYRCCKFTHRPTLPAWTWPVILLTAFGVIAILQPTAQALERAWPFCLFIGLAIPFVGELPDSWLTRAAKVVAKYSYGIYLSHVIVLWFAFVVLYNAPIAINWIVFGLGVAVASLAAYHLIEAPGISLGIRLAHGNQHQADNQASASAAPAP
jgi:peptidoglycan/LPS O-acetylase OafA/YrhL